MLISTVVPVMSHPPSLALPVLVAVANVTAPPVPSNVQPGVVSVPLTVGDPPPPLVSVPTVPANAASGANTVDAVLKCHPVQGAA